MYFWEDVFEGSLDDVAGHGCNVTIQEFILPSEREEQYVRFTAVSFFHTGAGLQFIGFPGKKS